MGPHGPARSGKERIAPYGRAPLRTYPRSPSSLLKKMSVLDPRAASATRALFMCFRMSPYGMDYIFILSRKIFDLTGCQEPTRAANARWCATGTKILQ